MRRVREYTCDKKLMQYKSQDNTVNENVHTGHTQSMLMLYNVYSDIVVYIHR